MDSIISATSSFDRLQTEMVGNRITELVRRFGTPLCVHVDELFSRNLRNLVAFDVVRYAPSAGCTLGMLKRLRGQGVSLAVSNAIEIRQGIAAGYSTLVTRGIAMTPNMIYAGNLLDRESLDLVAKLGLHVVCGSADMIDQIGQLRPGSDVTLCVNPFYGQASSASERFTSLDAVSGIALEQIEDCLFKADQYGIMVTGMQLYLKRSGELQELEKAWQTLMSAISIVGRTVMTVGVVGELPLRHSSQDGLQLESEFRQKLSAHRQRIGESVGQSIQYETTVEDSLFAGSRTLISEVRAVKKIRDIRCYVVDGEVNDFLPSAASSNEGRIAICPRDAATHERPLVDAYLHGPSNRTGESSLLTELRHQRLPISVVGDYVLIHDPIGDTELTSNFHGVNRRTEILLKNGEASVLCERATYDG